MHCVLLLKIVQIFSQKLQISCFFFRFPQKLQTTVHFKVVRKLSQKATNLILFSLTPLKKFLRKKLQTSTFVHFKMPQMKPPKKYECQLTFSLDL